MNIFSKITKRTMLQNKSRTLVTLIGVVLSTAMITAVTSFGASLQKFLVDSSISQEGDWHGMAAGPHGGNLFPAAGAQGELPGGGI